jgi:hypothetical protein
VGVRGYCRNATFRLAPAMCSRHHERVCCSRRIQGERSYAISKAGQNTDHEGIIRLHIKPSLGRVGLKKLTQRTYAGYTARSWMPDSPPPLSARSTPLSTRRSHRP